MTKSYDLVVIGGGIGGYTAALEAAKLNKKVALIEKYKVGGTCLHKGCIPSKTYLKSAEVLRQMKSSNTFGVHASSIDFHFEQVKKRADDIVLKLFQNVQALMNHQNIDVYEGEGRLLGPSIFSPSANSVSILLKNETQEVVTGTYLLLATGSKPRHLSVPKPVADFFHTSDEAFLWGDLPKSVLVIGGGVIGVEWASMLCDFGSEVTIVEAGQSLLPNEDVSISNALTNAFIKRGIAVMSEATVDVAHTKKVNDSVELVIQTAHDKLKRQFDRVFVAIGRSGNVEEIGLKNTSIEQNNGFIVVNDAFQTKEAHIYAIGDVIGGDQLAHAAQFEARVAVHHMFSGQAFPYQKEHVPRCVYSYPEVASIGLTEEKAKEKASIKVKTFSFKHNGKAMIHGDEIGFIKMIIDQDTDDVLGIHLIGANVTELIGEGALVKSLDASAEELSLTIHPHPSLSEIYVDALKF